MQKVYCRNDYIQKIVRMLTQSDVKQINVSGLFGVGKLLISGAAIKYVLDRNYYPDGAIQIEQSSVPLTIQIADSLGISATNEDDLIASIKTMHLIILVETKKGCAENTCWLQPLQKVLMQTENIKAVIVWQKRHKCKDSSDQKIFKPLNTKMNMI